MSRRPVVCRAPMRSRRDDVDPALAVERALSTGLCGTGGLLPGHPASLAEALAELDRVYDERTARRTERFATVPDGSFVWTRTGDGLFHVGVLAGGWRYDPSDAARRADLVHVRPCRWRPGPVGPSEAPPAVRRTFARGGRNFQQVHDPDVLAQSAALYGNARAGAAGPTGR